MLPAGAGSPTTAPRPTSGHAVRPRYGRNALEMPRRSVEILNPTDDRRFTSRKRALSAVARGVMNWVVKGVSMRRTCPEPRETIPSQCPLRDGPSLPAPIWAECWRNSEAAVLQPYQPYERLTGI